LADQGKKAEPMTSVMHILQVIASSTVIYGSRLGIIGIFVFPAMFFLSTWLGDRVFRLYALASAAGVGLLIARLLADFVHAASLGS
jgi:hypothetical protein